MADSDPRPTDRVAPPVGTEADGMDPYPTYHDSPAPARHAGATKPTDSSLPRSRRTYALPILIGLAVFALVIIIRIVWGGINMAETSDEASTPGDPASPPVAAAPASAPETPASPASTAEETGTPGDTNQEQTQTGPGEVEAAPGAIDVPGGGTTTPVEPAPAPAQ